MTSSPHRSPRWIKKVLGLFLDPRLLEASLGDLEEKFFLRTQQGTPRWKASLLYIIEAFGFLRMARLQRNSSAQATINMIGHTFFFFSRLIRRDVSYYAVSLLGLTLSLTSFLFIMMFVNDELSYDRMHEKKDRIYRLTTHLKLNAVEYHMATSQFPAAQAIQSEMGEAEHVVRIYPQNIEFTVHDKKFREHIILADDHFFDMFSFPWLYGDKQTALKESASIILTQSAAVKYFGNDNPVGKTILVTSQPLTVTGVIEDVPDQSHMKFTAIVPLALQLGFWRNETGLEGRENKWFWIGAYTYILLRNSADVQQADANLHKVTDKYFPDRYKEHGAFKLQPLTDIHLKSSLSNELEAGGNMLYVQLFSVVGLMIMIVSAINLINLSYFKIGARVREVGIRKFLGQNAFRIVLQLSIESVLMGLTAFLAAFLLCCLLLPEFNLLVQKNFNLFSRPNLAIAGATLVLISLICMVAVIRPAFRYAAQSAGYLLLGKYNHSGSTQGRNILIGLQVSFSFVLMVFTFIVSGQIDFFRHKDLGFEKENVFSIQLNEDIYTHAEAFKSELRKDRSIREVAGGNVPGVGYAQWRFVPEGGSYEKPFLFPVAWVDYSFVTTLNIKVVAGKNFDPNDRYDSLWGFIINKKAAMELGWLTDPVNRKMEIFAPGTTEIMANGRVVGVIEDYNFESLHKPIQPVVLIATTDADNILVNAEKGSQKDAIAHMERTWKKFSGKPFAYEDADKKLDKLYTNEAKFSNLMLFFTFIALYLTCYGMFAMSSLMFSSKLKEVAIRKVLGANQLSILSRFYSRYALFNLAAIIVGIPVALFAGNLWLQTFQYRIDLDFIFFLRAALIVLLAGLLSVTYYLVQVAVSNPVKFLRNE